MKKCKNFIFDLIVLEDNKNNKNDNIIPNVDIINDFYNLLYDEGIL